MIFDLLYLKNRGKILKKEKKKNENLRVTENLDEETELSSTLGSPRNPFFVQQMSFFFILKTVKS